MDLGQEFTHSVTTTINSESQHVVNETTLVDGSAVILQTKQTVNLPVGATYHIETQGDINDHTVKRVLNMANNLLGVQAFSFSSANDAIDTDLAILTASYDSETHHLKGTAPIDSTVRIILEDDTSIRVLPKSDSTWTYQLDVEKQLQFGTNKIIVVDATRDSSFLVLNIEREKPSEPLKEGFTFMVSADGTKVSGTVEDVRATVHVETGTYSLQVVTANDLTWSIDIPEPLSHQDNVSVFVSLSDQVSPSQHTVFYKDTAQLDQATGQYISGTSTPMAIVVVNTPKYGELTTTANDIGIWKVDFVAGLPADATVQISINSITLPDTTYIGPANIEFKLSAKIKDSTHLEGTAEALTQVTIIAGTNTAFDIQSDAQGKWNTLLTTALNDGDSVLVSTASAQVELQYNLEIINSGITTFTAALEGTQTLTGYVDANATIHVAFEDNNTLDTVVTSGNFNIDLGKMLTPNEQIVVSCIVGSTIYKTIQLNA